MSTSLMASMISLTFLTLNFRDILLLVTEKRSDLLNFFFVGRRFLQVSSSPLKRFQSPLITSMMALTQLPSIEHVALAWQI